MHTQAAVRPRAIPITVPYRNNIYIYLDRLYTCLTYLQPKHIICVTNNKKGMVYNNTFDTSTHKKLNNF